MAKQEAGGDIFFAVSAPTRREILRMLRDQDLPVTGIAESFDMSLSAVSQHLSVLRKANLVVHRKEGKQRVYRLTPYALVEIADWLGQYSHFWEQKLSRLETYLDEKK